MRKNYDFKNAAPNPYATLARDADDQALARTNLGYMQMMGVGHKCTECGQGKITARLGPGRVWRYRVLEIEMPSDVATLECNHCGARYVSAENAEAHDGALAPLYAKRLAKEVEVSLKRLEGVPRNEIERALGLSHGYFSRILAGDRTTSPELVALLHLASKSGSLEKVQALWSKLSDKAPPAKSRKAKLRPPAKRAIAAKTARAPSRESLKEMPEVDFTRAKVQRNPYAARIGAK